MRTWEELYNKTAYRARTIHGFWADKGPEDKWETDTLKRVRKILFWNRVDLNSVMLEQYGKPDPDRYHSDQHFRDVLRYSLLMDNTLGKAKRETTLSQSAANALGKAAEGL